MVTLAGAVVGVSLATAAIGFLLCAVGFGRMAVYALRYEDERVPPGVVDLAVQDALVGTCILAASGVVGGSAFAWAITALARGVACL